jgi:hypothetical protein
MIRAGRYRAVTVKGRKYVGYSADDIAKIEAALKQEGS